MNEREWKKMDDPTFETVLKTAVPELPPEDLVSKVTPWKRAVDRVLIGIALTALTLNFWHLAYILPAIGAALLALGFRALRRENRWFACCFAVSLVRAVYVFSFLLLNTTIVQSQVNASALGTALSGMNLALLLLLFFCQWRGFLSVQKKAGLSPHAGGAAALIVWYALLCLLALLRYSGWIVAVLMLIVYIFILRSLYTLSKELDEAGYMIRTAPVRITDRCAVLSLALVLTVGCVCGYWFCAAYPMEWSAPDPAEHREVEDVKAHLASLGFPDYALNDLSAADIEACRGALQVVVRTTEKTAAAEQDPIGDLLGGGRVHDVYQKYFSGDGVLRLTGIGVQVPGERERWIIFHHFLWVTPPVFYGTESIRLCPTYQIAEGWQAAGGVSGRVLYDRDGTSLAADLYSLGEQTYTSDSIFFGKQSNTDIFAAFSLPRGGANYRGYVAYPVDELQDGYIISSQCIYTHHRPRIQYPAQTAQEAQQTIAPQTEKIFRDLSSALQFYPMALVP